MSRNYQESAAFQRDEARHDAARDREATSRETMRLEIETPAELQAYADQSAAMGRGIEITVYRHERIISRGITAESTLYHVLFAVHPQIERSYDGVAECLAALDAWTLALSLTEAAHGR